MFEKKCTLCGDKITKGKEIIASVKMPEWQNAKEKPFCSKKHVKKFQETILGTPRRHFCPSCGV